MLCVARIQAFGNCGLPYRIDDHLIHPARILTLDNPSSSAFRRSKATILYYRNNPHDTSTDYYAILGIPRTANDAEIKRAYRNRAKQFHPDANPDMDTTAIFQELNRAYEVLRDPELKSQYDMFGMEGLGTSATSDRTAAAAAAAARNTAARGQSRPPYHAQQYGRDPFHRHSSPFHHQHGPPQSPPPRRSPYQSPFQSSVHAPRPGSHGPRPQKHPSSFGDSPFGDSWDPWKSPFADVYNARIETDGHHQRMHDTTFVDSGAGFNAAHVNTNVGRRNSPPGSMADFIDFTTFRPNDVSSGTRRRWVGGDLCIRMEIDHQTAVEGGEEKIRIKHLVSCTTCTGNGIQPGAEVKICEHCKGSGAMMTQSEPVGMGPTNNYSKQEICRHCRGTGQSVAENCSTCHGKGVKEAAKEITVIIPPGIGDGAKLRLKGEGDAGPMGGPAGDLFIFLSIKNGSPQNTRIS